MAFLYEKIDALREYGSSAVLPSYIPENLNPNFELRPYQKQAFENFITHFESSNRPKPTQVLFHMATGSGKTLIMAGLMLYLYKQGYRNFLFFVNLSNIVEKTRENFRNPTSSKYLLQMRLCWTGNASASTRWTISSMPTRMPSTSALPPRRDFIWICGWQRKTVCPLTILTSRRSC